MSVNDLETPTLFRRSHDFRRVTDVTIGNGRDGDRLYRMSASDLDDLAQSIRVQFETVM